MEVTRYPLCGRPGPADKKDGLIDQFIYGSISPAYLVALMDTL